MRPRRNPISRRLGSALVMTLVIIVLITVVTVGYLASVMLETKTATSSLDQERAYGVAMVGVHEAMSRVRDALGPWDDPYRNFFTNAPPFYWSVSPGRLTRFSYGDLTSSNFALFSESSVTNTVNLNRQIGDGSYPILGTTNALSVRWVNLLQNPSLPASPSNAIIGRYAFWVDTEGAKINVNTADGTAKYTTNSLGIGSPTEVSLQVLAGTNGQPLSVTNAQSIVQVARTSNFQSPREILRVSGVTADVYTNNVFSLTAYSRSPELNVFGQPRVAVSPLLGEGGPHWRTATNMAINSLTLLPAREIYPTPSQLPNYVISSPYDVIPNTPRSNHPWPLSLRGEMGINSTGKGEDYRSIMKWYPSEVPNYSYNQGYLLAKYLAGTNAGEQRVFWPVFPGPASSVPSTNGFAGKYTPRQLDSIIAQILSIGSKAISSDYPHTSGESGEQIGNHYMVTPYVFPGWLSQQWVIGVGRSIKLTEVYVDVAAYGSQGIWDPANPAAYQPPKATMDIWLEWWLPASYFGGDTSPNAFRFFLGHRGAKSTLNVIDMPRSLKNDPNPPKIEFAAPLPRVPDGDSPEEFSYWAKELLQNDQGIDFAGNPDTAEDRDQDLARRFHDPFTRHDAQSTSGPWDGATSPTTFLSVDYIDYSLENTAGSPFIMTKTEPAQNAAKEWPAGEMRSIYSRLGPSFRMPMQTNTIAFPTLSIRGGIAVKTQLKDGHFTDPDPVPLEAVRGAYQKDGVSTQEPFTIQDETDEVEVRTAWKTWPAVPTNAPAVPPGAGSLRDRVRESVIPVVIDVPIPPPSTNVAFGGPARQVTLKVRDPLVNKFPGDWEPFPNTGPDRMPSPIDRAVPGTYDDTAFRATLTDPDSYWMPRADVGLSTSISQVASQTLIPRSARMPNIGYLQYVRTGIIPDDESEIYSQQHGTPFRLLSFAPSYEASDPSDPLVGQKTTRPGSHPLGESQPYPDWALLDLFYMPSTLAPYGSTYGPAIASPTTNSVETKLLYYGTYGGATAGKINPNGAIIYTTNVNVAETNISRTLPLQAVLNGVRVNDTLMGVGTNAVLTNGRVVDASDASEIAQAIESYVRTNGPLRMPAEICNVPRVAVERAANNPTRNDLVRQIVGALSTQDNVFSVWTVGQAVQKRPGNGQFDQFEAGDNVLAEVRLHFVVERYLDPGADGIYGNPVHDGPDTVVGTYDDPMDANNHPFQPRYLYRVVASEEIR